MKLVVGIVLVLVGLSCFLFYLYHVEQEKEKKEPPKKTVRKKTLPPKKVSAVVVPEEPHIRDITRLMVQNDSEGAARIIKKWIREK